MPLPKESFKVFLSHSTEDTDLTWRIAETLDRLHIRTFVYEFYLAGGENRFEKIKEMIVGTKYFLVLLTENGLKSQWVNQEIGYAVGMRKTLIPIVQIDSVTGERLKSDGFVELHDQISFNPNLTGGMISNLVYTFYSWLLNTGRWSDRIWLTCKCGYEWDKELDYSYILAHPEWTGYYWDCPACKNSLSIGLPGFELRFLE